jgi:transcriptional regulator with XRE-family HTH domain
MHGGDYILMARQRARITQRELAARLGCQQATIARWERDDRHPSLAETQAAVLACGFDLGVSLVADDRSWWPQIAVQLERSPVGQNARYQDTATADARSNELTDSSSPEVT